MSPTAAPAPVRLAEVRRLCVTGAGRVIRESAAVSLREMARHLEVDPTTLSRWERGEQQPTCAAALRYLALLDAMRGPYA